MSTASVIDSADPTAPPAEPFPRRGALRRLTNAAAHVLGRADDGVILEMALVHRASRGVMQRVGKDLDPPQARKISEMLAFLHQSLRDETLLARYAGFETFRVEKLTYAVHAGPLAILISVIAGRRPAPVVARCRALLDSLHATHPVALGDYDPSRAPTGLLPPLNPPGP